MQKKMPLDGATITHQFIAEGVVFALGLGLV